MADDHADSIAELAALVERLSRAWLAAAPQGAPAGGESVAGRPLAAWLAELWPGAAGWSGLAVDEELAALHLSRRGQERRLRLSELERLRANMDKAQARINQMRHGADQRLEAFGQALQKAQAAEERQRAMAQEAAAAARQHRKQVLAHNRWLQGLTPLGRKAFRDAQGRQVDWDHVRQVEARRRAAEARQNAEEERAHMLGLELKEAMAQRAAAARDLALAQSADRHAARSEALAQAKLSAAAAGLSGRKALLIEAVEAEKQARELKLLCQKTRQLAQELLERAVVEAPADDPLPAARLALAEAQRRQAHRLRLEKILRAQDARLARLARRGGEALKAVRRVNRQIEALELALPALVATLNGPQAADPAIRGKAASELSLLLAGLDDLTPQAAQAQLEVERLRLALELGLERAKGLLEAWREAVRLGREQRNAAGQGLERARQWAAQAAAAASQAQEAGRPVLLALGGLRHGQLAPALGRVIETVGALRQRAKAALADADTLEAALNDLGFVALNKPPMALKPHSLPLRRISGRNVHLSRLEALGKSARRWRGLAEGGLIRAVSQPLRQVALNLSGSLGLLAQDHGQLRQSLDQSREESSQLRQSLDQSNLQGRHLQENIARLKAVAHQQRQTIQQQSALLAQADEERRKAAAVSHRLEQAVGDIENLSLMLERSRTMAEALRAKSLERHRRLRQSQADLAAAMSHVEISRQRQLELETTRKALERAQGRLQASRQRLERATAQRDELQSRLAAVEAAQAANDLRQAQAGGIQAELEAAREEARRWAALAGDMVVAMGLGHQRNQELERQVLDLAGQADDLRQRLGQLGVFLALAAKGQRAQLSSAQMSRLLERLRGARQRLAAAGRGAMGQLLLIGGLVSGLILFAADNPSKATLRGPDSVAGRALDHGEEPAEIARAAQRDQAQAVLADSTVGGPRPLPLYKPNPEMTLEERALTRRLASAAHLSPKALLRSARQLFPDRDVIDAADLHELVDASQVLAKRHPLIFQELAVRGLPKTALGLAAVTPAAEEGRALFLDRLYREYRDLGFTDELALAALTQNETAVRRLKDQWQPSQWFHGKVRPLPEVESMSLEQFVERMAPYIADRAKVFMKLKDMPVSGDIALYGRNLAFDIYCAAHKFQVPLTFMLAIGHQETWYANILGDNDLSASPFQIYQPTKLTIIDSMATAGMVAPPKTIDLQQNLSMAVFMAAYHLRELMQQAHAPAQGNRPATIDMDRVMKAYNGSDSYAGKVAGRQGELAMFLAQNL